MNKCFWCDELLTDEQLLWDCNAEPYCPVCSRHGILSNVEEPEKLD